VSSDKDEGQFKNYYGEQYSTATWTALPYESRDVKAKLSKKYKVKGIPSLVILDAKTGETITAEGRDAFAEDMKGAKFPWRPPSIWECLGSEFLQGADGDTVDLDEIRGKGKVIGLYFSAHWCPPCKMFTPQLIEAYKSHLKAKNLEVIFVSSDRDAASFQGYFGEMPWLAIPNGDPRVRTLSTRFNVEGIPSFVLVDGETGETISDNARAGVSSDPTGAEFPWRPKPLNTLDNPDGINDEPALIVLLENCDDASTAAAKEVLMPMAEASKAGKEELLWFYAPKAGDIAQKVRDLTKLGPAGTAPQMILLDIPDEGGYYVAADGPITTEAVSKFLADWKEKSPALERKQLG